MPCDLPGRGSGRPWPRFAPSLRRLDDDPRSWTSVFIPPLLGETAPASPAREVGAGLADLPQVVVEEAVGLTLPLLERFEPRTGPSRKFSRRSTSPDLPGREALDDRLWPAARSTPRWRGAAIETRTFSSPSDPRSSCFRTPTLFQVHRRTTWEGNPFSSRTSQAPSARVPAKPASAPAGDRENAEPAASIADPAFLSLSWSGAPLVGRTL